MIEIKVNTVKDSETKQEIHVEAQSKHSGKYGDFVREMTAVLGVLDKTDHGVFIDALTDYLMERTIDNLKKASEGDSDE